MNVISRQAVTFSPLSIVVNVDGFQQPSHFQVMIPVRKLQFFQPLRKT